MPSSGTPISKASSGARGVSSFVTEAGPPEKMMPRGIEVADPGEIGVVGHDLAIDAGFAHAPRDELGELAAEIED